MKYLKKLKKLKRNWKKQKLVFLTMKIKKKFEKIVLILFDIVLKGENMLSKILVWMFLSIAFLYAGQSKVYIIEIEVEGTKSNNKPWDMAGGAPDIKLIIDEKELVYDKKCANKYRCSMFFTSDNEEWYFEILDKDFRASDLIGKGKCSLGKECSLGLAKVKIEEKVGEE